MSMGAGRWLIVMSCVLLLSACGSLGRLPTQYSVRDLGLPGKAGAPPPIPIRAIQVKAPSWLGSSAMQYRASDPVNLLRRAYIGNRWAAAPAELVEVALQRALPTSNPEGGGCVLLVDLDEFSQVFSSALDSYALVEARLSLSSPRDDAVFAVEQASIRVPAATPDAQGGALALSVATGKLADDIAAWLASVASEAPSGTKSSARCR